LAQETTVIVIEVPERVDSRDLLQDIVNRCAALSLRDEAGKVLRVIKPLIQSILDRQGLPLDLAELATQPGRQTGRAVLELPTHIAAETDQRLILFLDEVQRIVDYSDGGQLLRDLIDIYGTRNDVTVMLDGSEERTIAGLYGPPVEIGKLAAPYELAQTIEVSVWREPLRARFDRVNHPVRADALEDLLAFGSGRPYETVLACRHAALTAHRLGSEGSEVTAFEAEMGIDAAKAQLEADHG
jgi:hypothetical protein